MVLSRTFGFMGFIIVAFMATGNGKRGAAPPNCAVFKNKINGEDGSLKKWLEFLDEILFSNHLHFSTK